MGGSAFVSRFLVSTGLHPVCSQILLVLVSCTYSSSNFSWQFIKWSECHSQYLNLYFINWTTPFKTHTPRYPFRDANQPCVVFGLKEERHTFKLYTERSQLGSEPRPSSCEARVLTIPACSCSFSLLFINQCSLYLYATLERLKSNNILKSKYSTVNKK